MHLDPSLVAPVWCGCVASSSTIMVVAVILLLAAPSSPALAADVTAVAEAVRQGAANLPGHRPTNVFPPSSWQGTWKTRRQVVSLQQTGDTTIDLEYAVRFLPSH
jgi:hypothetical protein